MNPDLLLIDIGQLVTLAGTDGKPKTGEDI
jgi:hypothetical protein